MEKIVKNYISGISSPRLLINTEPTQYTVGKTKKCINFIKTYGVGKINLYFVNNSLEKTNNLYLVVLKNLN